MTIDDKLHDSKTEKNCFLCDGTDESCYTYFEYKNGKCLYRKIADTDLIKAKSGIGCITLESMYKEYIEMDKNR